MSRLSDELAALATMSPAQLRAEWRRVLRTLPPQVPTDILRRGIAYRLQEKVYGSLPASTARELHRIAARLASRESPKHEVRLKAGSRLVRSWQGTTYTVIVTDDGFAMDNRWFASLSQVARAITGAHWSGPRFFGLKPTAATTGAAAVSRERSVGLPIAKPVETERADA